MSEESSKPVSVREESKLLGSLSSIKSYGGVESSSIPKPDNESYDFQKLRNPLQNISRKILSLLVATTVSLMDNLPYGYLILPGLLREYVGCIVTQVMVSVVVAQAIFAIFSDFDCALGCNIVENTPFLKAMAASITHKVTASAQDRIEERAIATILVCFALCTLLVGISFFLLGFFRLGEYTYCFPKQILVGGVGGMGTYLLLAGIGVSCDVETEKLSLTVIKELILEDNWPKWMVVVLLESMLLFLNRAFKSQFVTPIFLFSIPFLFGLTLFTIGSNYMEARNSDWMFKKLDHTNSGISHLLSKFDFELVNWDVLFEQGTIICSLVIFSVLHVPLNIPGLSMIIGRDANVSKEFIAHAISNCVSGGIGCLQNYMVLSTSALYYRIGGNGRLASLSISALLFLCFKYGSYFFHYIPRCLGGTVCVHLGLDLLNEALIVTWKEFTNIEYFTVVTIILAMTFYGFVEGIVFGAILAMFLYIRESSAQKRIEIYDMHGVRSRKIRKPAERNLLDQVMDATMILVRLNSELFFGNSRDMFDRIGLTSALKFIVMDCHQLIHVDCSGIGVLKQLLRLCEQNNIQLLFCSVESQLHERLLSVGILGSSFSKVFCDLNGALEFAETTMMMELQASPGAFLRIKNTVALIRTMSETTLKVYDASAVKHSLSFDESGTSHDVSFVDGFSKICGADVVEIEELRSFFVRKELPEGAVLWEKDEEAEKAIFVEKGLLGVFNYENRIVDYTVPGQLSGELALCTRERQRYTVRTLEKCIIWELSKQSYLSMPSRPLSNLQAVALQFASHRLNILAALGHVHSV